MVVAILVVAAAAPGAVAAVGATRRAALASRSPAAPANFVGSQACAGCHANATKAWTGSQHARAMQEATEQTVLGDFADRRFDHRGSTAIFSKRDGKFFVRTDGPDGKPADFEIKYTFGVEPLQQYLIELPGGRLQALTIAWDTAAKRWFSLYPEREDSGARRTALDGAAAELEFHVRRLPFDQPAQELRCVGRHVRDGMVGNPRRLRIVPRSGFQPHRVGRQARRRPAHRA